MPKFVAPELATLTRQVPTGDAWLHEIKSDGYRILAEVRRGEIRLWSRNEQEWTAKFKHVAELVAGLNLESAWLDGEVIATESNGISSFQRLQNALRENRGAELSYEVFDLLYLDGYDLRGVTLENRKALLSELLAQRGPGDRLRATEHFEGDGAEFFRQASRLGLEGIISKRRDRAHVGGRTTDWLKIKSLQRDEFVIGGFTEPAGARLGLGALLVGYYDDQQRLHYAGRVGTGFSDSLLKEMRDRLARLETRTSPFVEMTSRQTPKGTHWVKPLLVAQVEFSQWTDDRQLRHPSFQGLREDKSAGEVRRDVPRENSPMNARAKNVKSSAAHEKAVAIPAKPVGPKGEIEIAGVRMTNPDRVLYPEEGLTKFGLAEYYLQVAEWMLPYLKGRPLTLVRCPSGQHKSCFYQKHLGKGAPAALRSVAIKEKDGTVGDYALADDVAGLVSLVQLGILEIHIWGSREDSLEQPDVLVFDFDPDEKLPWSAIAQAAREMRDLLGELGLETLVKTTGGKGLHVLLPIRRRWEWPQVKEFARAVATSLAARSPEKYTTNMSKAARPGKIFIDYLRNERGATFVAPFSTRARLGAPVSMPVAWDEIGRIHSDHFTVGNAPVRLAALDRDPWAEFGKLKQSLTMAMLKKLQG